jgi:bacillithiol synthase
MKKRTLNRLKSGYFSDLSNEITYNQSKFKDLISFPFSMEAFEEQIKLKENSFPPAKRDLLVSELKNQYQHVNNATKSIKNIESLTSFNTFTVTTGHQLNIFTGPIYFIYKILHVIQLAEKLQLKYPKNNFIPVFWMATEDHDFEEINHTTVFGKKVTWNENQGGPVGKYELKNWTKLIDEIKLIFQNHLESEVNEILDSYNGINLADATRNLVHALFGKYGLVIIDGDSKGFKSSFSEIMCHEVNTQFSQKNVLESNKLIENLGHKPQVFTREINLFYITSNLRSRLVIRENQIEIDGLGEFSKDEIIILIKNNPENFSPNVILRPLYQETILPNLAYIGGGGEIAYWIQLKSVFEEVKIAYPLIQVRNSVLLIEKNIQKKTAKLNLNYEDFFKDINQLKKDFILSKSNEKLNFSSINTIVNQLAEQIEIQILANEAGLKSYAEAEIVKLKSQMEAIQSKLLKNQKTKFESDLIQIENLKNKLFPNNQLQERKENLLSFCGNGNVSSLIENLKTQMDPNENDLLIIEI